MFNESYNPGIYSASKIWHNTRWTALRDVHGFNITSRWINVPCGSFDNPSGAKAFSPPEKTELWMTCDEDICNADMTICYGEERDELRGAVVEFGMTLGQGKPTYFFGKNKFFLPNVRSDAAYMHHPLVHYIPVREFADGSFDCLEAYKKAVQHYRENYHTPERVFRNTRFLTQHENIASRVDGFRITAVANAA
jgi:hypothetical protein